MEYDYIKRAYGLTFRERDRVVNLVSNKCGEVMRPRESHHHYVRVNFGVDGIGLCHPGELRVINDPQTEGDG